MLCVNEHFISNQEWSNEQQHAMSFVCIDGTTEAWRRRWLQWSIGYRYTTNPFQSVDADTRRHARLTLHGTCQNVCSIAHSSFERHIAECCSEGKSRTLWPASIILHGSLHVECSSIRAMDPAIPWTFYWLLWLILWDPTGCTGVIALYVCMSVCLSYVGYPNARTHHSSHMGTHYTPILRCC